VITCHNYARFVRQAIRSVLKQHFPLDQVQLIVVDDGSSDDSASVIDHELNDAVYDQLFHREMVVRPAGEDNCSANARNVGWQSTKAEFIQFLDADDEMLPNCLGNRSVLLERYAGAVGVYSDFLSIYEDGSMLQPEWRPPFWFVDHIQECVVSTNPMVRRSVLEHVGGYDSSFYYIEDYDFTWRASHVGPWLHCPAWHFKYRQGKHQKTRNVDARLREEYQRLYRRMHHNVPA